MYIYIYTYIYIATVVCHGFCQGVFRIRLRHLLLRSFRDHGDGVRFVGSVGSCHLSMNHRVNVSENLSHPRYNLSWFDQSGNESLAHSLLPNMRMNWVQRSNCGSSFFDVHKQRESKSSVTNL